ncbi:hypothetical protein B0H14DRAFT_3732536 [Mycena olivaceomarginata]|nr:hypothetical protein B0H14DRAFT_3732536 [Mycena olivaceomarginata]
MLKLAVKKLKDFDPQEDEMTTRARKLLQKCAYAMISQQELSAQQVALYLLDFEDHFTSHSYRNFYWTSFENFINREDLSPECYPTKLSRKVVDSESEPAPCTERAGEDEDDDSDIEHQTEPLFLNDLMDCRDGEETVELGDAEEEIRVSLDGSGNLVRMGHQLADY